jgi:glycosyltransferase involved in cell wall biosynthesis
VRGAERFHRWLARLRPDVVHFHTFVTGLGLHEVEAAKAAGARIVVTSHSSSLGWICQRGTMMRWGERLCDGLTAPAKCAACTLQHGGLPKPLAWVFGAIPPALGRVARSVPGKLGTALAMSDLITRNQEMQRKMLALVDKFVLLTEWALEAAAANGAPREKLTLNRLGLSAAKPVPKPRAEERPTKKPIMVGYLGRFEAIKGVYDLARAAASLACDVHLRVEFRGPVTSQAEQTVVSDLKRLTAEDSRIGFAPAVPHAEALQVLAGYDVLCCPSLCLEGGPTVAFEAQAMGTPVIGTRIGGLAEVVADGVNGQLVAPGDWRALAVVLKAMAGDPLGTIDCWRQALAPVRTMDQIAADYLKLYTP